MSDSVWYVVYTKPQKEAAACDSISAKGFNAFCPWGQQDGKPIRALFPRYLFFECHRNMDWWPVMSCTGVNRLLCDTNDFPVAVSHSEITKLRAELGPDDTAQIHTRARLPDFKAGEVIQIIDGAFRGLRGECVKVTGQDRIRILLDMIGRKTVISVPTAFLAGG